MKRIKDIKELEWIKPTRRNYRLICCSCGSEHFLDFDLIDWSKGKAIVMRFKRKKS